jgi:hypothetical protein
MVGADDRAASGLSQPWPTTNHKQEENGNAATNAGTKNEHEYPSLQSGHGGLKDKWGQAVVAFYIVVWQVCLSSLKMRLIDGQKLLEPGEKLRFARQRYMGEMKEHDAYHPELLQ